MQRIVTVAERIKHWRTQAGLTQAQLAHAVGVTPSAACFWERGDNAPRAKHLAAIASACGITEQIFWGRIPDPEFTC